jgi:hypothetical protein
VNFADTILEKLPVELRRDAKAGAPGFGAVVYLDFPPGTNMGRVKTEITKLHLKHTDADNEQHSLRTAPDVPVSVRHRGRALGALWKLVQPHLDSLTDMQDYKLGNSNGKLFVIQGDRPAKLFATVTDDAGLHLVPNDKSMEKFKIPAALASS